MPATVTTQHVGQSVAVRLADHRGKIKTVIKDFHGPDAEEKMERWLLKMEDLGELIEVLGYSPLPS